MLLSLHLKATMMKVSDPIMFGHAVTVYYKDVFDKHAELFEELGVDPNNGVGDVYARIANLPADQKAEIEADLASRLRDAPAELAMVNSDKGITNLHVPSDIIIDASMPAALRASGKMWGPDGELHDMLAMIPDRCYAGIYQAVIDDCRTQWRLRRADDGQRLQRGPDGEEGRGVRLPRQDVRDPGTGTVRVRDAEGNVADRARRPRGRHLAHVPDEGRRRFATGSRSRSAVRGTRAPRRSSGSTRTAGTMRA